VPLISPFFFVFILYYETLSQLKEKHTVIEGEILAGKDNPQLLKDFKDVLMKLYHFKAISIPAINKYLKNFE
jgi:hypothetical protein